MIILFGKPGAGKGTQADLLVKEEDYVWISAGELLRNKARQDARLLAILNAGELVGGDQLFPLISGQLKRYGHKRIILDGFPRDRSQAEWLKSQLEENPPEKIDLIILEISDNEVRDRLARRGRTDDMPDAISERIKIYKKDVMQAIQFLGETADVHYIDGQGSVAQVHQRVLTAIDGDNR